MRSCHPDPDFTSGEGSIIHGFFAVAQNDMIRGLDSSVVATSNVAPTLNDMILCHPDPEYSGEGSRKIMKEYYIYILASKKNGTLYIGVTSNLARRVWQHKNEVASGFTSEYKIHNLVYFEQYKDINDAIRREKYLKGKSRKYKLELIEKDNSNWLDLYDSIK